MAARRRWRRGNLFFGGDPGIGRMFGLSMGTEVSWLLPAALIGLVAGLWLTRRTAAHRRVRASLLLWGGWLLVTGAVFSFMGGTVHPYYAVALAPAIAALVGISVRELWRGRQFCSRGSHWQPCLAATGVWAFVLLDRTPDWLPALRWVVLAGAVSRSSDARRRCAPIGPRQRRARHRRSAFRPRRHGCVHD